MAVSVRGPKAKQKNPNGNTEKQKYQRGDLVIN
jgi:hypothetical protein